MATEFKSILSVRTIRKRSNCITPKFWVCIRTFNESDLTGLLIQSLAPIELYEGAVMVFDGGSDEQHLIPLSDYDIDLYTLDNCKFDFGKSVNSISSLIGHLPFFLFSGHVRLTDPVVFFAKLTEILDMNVTAYFRQIPGTHYNLYESLYLKKAFPTSTTNPTYLKPSDARLSNSACFYGACILNQIPITRFGGGEEPVWLRAYNSVGFREIAYYSDIEIEHSHAYSPTEVHKVVLSTANRNASIFYKVIFYIKFRVGIFTAMILSGSSITDANSYSKAHATAYLES